MQLQFLVEGLEYFHVGCMTKIIHKDVKSSNIFLDRNLNGKLADFGISTLTIDEEAAHVTTTVKGTAGYLDLEYIFDAFLAIFLIPKHFNVFSCLTSPLDVI